MSMMALTSIGSPGAVAVTGQIRHDGGRLGSIQARTECFAERDHAGAR
jgi:hypothetical protein